MNKSCPDHGLSPSLGCPKCWRYHKGSVIRGRANKKGLTHDETEVK